MIGYTTLGTHDLERSRAFYDKVLAPLGARRAITSERSQFYIGPSRGPMLAIFVPFDGEDAKPGNGWMVALVAPDMATVESVHATALIAGGTCDGPPGPRVKGFYGAYFRDPDGNKLCIYTMV